MKKTFVSIILILFVCCAIGILLPSTGIAQTKFYPKKVYVATGDGSLKEVTDPGEIAKLYNNVKDKKCSLTIIGPRNTLPKMDKFKRDGFAHSRQPSETAVYIISCGTGDGGCRTVGGVLKCCPPTCW